MSMGKTFRTANLGLVDMIGPSLKGPPVWFWVRPHAGDRLPVRIHIGNLRGQVS
jgi:hypothetical protein